MYNRHRERDHLSPNFQTPVYNQNNVVVGSNWALRLGTREWCDDVVTPGFHKRVKRGEVFCNPFHKEIRNYSFMGGVGNAYHTILRPWETWRSEPEMFLVWIRMAYMPPNTDQWPLAFGFSDSDAEGLLIEASTRVHADRGTSDVNMWEAFAEIEKTLLMVDSARKEIHTLASAFAKTARAAKLKRVQAIGNLYLQYRYGLAPLVSSLSEVVLNLNQQLRGFRARITTRAKQEDTMNRIFHKRFASGPCAASVKIEVSDTICARAGSLDVTELTMQRDLGMTGKDLVTLPWELVPYSFVVDWFFNVGDCLGALVPAPHLQNLCSWCSVERTVKHVVTIPESWITDARYQQDRPMQGRFEAEFRIKARGYLRDPSLRLKNDFRFGRLTRVADAFALTAQLIKSNDQYAPPTPRLPWRKVYKGWGFGAI